MIRLNAAIDPLHESVRRAFHECFEAAPDALACAPGRVNLIGDHTDYNDGLALPIAIPLRLTAAARLHARDEVRVVSRALGVEARWDWHVADEPPAAWAAHVFGVARLLRERGARLPGFDLLLDGDLPPAAGLSSSAAVTVATTLVLAWLSGEPLMQHELIELCCTAEARFAGVPCGVLDPTAILASRTDHASLLDCRQSEVTHVPVNPELGRVLVVHSGQARQLAAGVYTQRRAECETAVAYFRSIAPEVRALRDVSPETVRAHALQMPPVAAARARHVCSEIARVRAFADALRGAAALTPDSPALETARETLGALLQRSHASLRDDFEASHPALDELVRVLNALPGVYGARLTGAGFGGCALAWVHPRRAASVEAGLRARYRPADGGPVRMWWVGPSAPAALVATG